MPIFEQNDVCQWVVGNTKLELEVYDILIDIMVTNKYHGSDRYVFDDEEVRKYGEMLNDEGGWDAMMEVYQMLDEFYEQFDDERYYVYKQDKNDISECWDGIGEWP